MNSDSNIKAGNIFHLTDFFKTDFLGKNAVFYLLIDIVLLLLYAPVIFSKGYCTDLEYMYIGDGLYNWSELGRFNLILLKKLTSFGSYKPVWEGVLFCLAFSALFLTLSVFFHILSGNNRYPVSLLAAALSLIFPTYAEQFYFRFQSFEVAFALFLLCLSNLILLMHIKKHSVILLSLSIVLAALSFGTYQSFMNVAVTFYFGMFIALLLSESKKCIITGALSCTAHFGLSLFLYKIISLIFCESGSYIEDKIKWSEYGFSTCFHFVIHYIKVTLFASKYAYTIAFLICIVISFSAIVYLFFKDIKKALWCFAGFTGLCASPFIMAIIQGFEAEARTQLSLPVATGFLFLFAVSVFFVPIKKRKSENKISFFKKSLYLIVLISGICSVFCNIAKTGKLIISGKSVSDADLLLAENIITDLTEYIGSDTVMASKPVIFTGVPASSKNESLYCYDNENKLYILSSVYSLDHDVAPEFFFSSNRILGFFSFLRYDFTRPDVSDYMNEAYILSESMPSYPDNGYISESTDCVVIKLNN